MYLTLLQFDVTSAAMNYWKNIPKMRNSAGPGDMLSNGQTYFPAGCSKEALKESMLPITVLH